MAVTVTDALGETFDIEGCSILCPRSGENDYGDPVALILPDGDTIVSLDSLTLLTQCGEKIDPSEIIDHLDD